MKKLKFIAKNHPIVFVFSSMIVWFVLELVLMSIASSALRKPYGDAVNTTISRLVTTACVLLLIWRMDGWIRQVSRV